VEPVLLLIEKLTDLVITVPGVQVLHRFPPVSVIPTSDKSFEVQLLGAGKVWAVDVFVMNPIVEKTSRKTIAIDFVVFFIF
jgi:hypothetical protein